jgi:DNA invertase Pin-like site-specific DNA recombinase
VSSNPGVALYLRVSTEDQDLDGQERELRSYAAKRGWSVAATYREKVSASGRVEREQLERLIADAAASTDWDRVLVWALDRWSRDPSFVRAIGSIEQLERQGIRWHSFKEPQLDSSDDGLPSLARDLLRGILPTIAAFEARRRSERTQLAMDQIRSGVRRTRTGRPIGRPRRLTSAIVQRILELRERGLKWREVALSVHLPAGTCRNALSASRRVTPSVENGPGQFRTKNAAKGRTLRSSRPTPLRDKGPF